MTGSVLLKYLFSIISPNWVVIHFSVKKMEYCQNLDEKLDRISIKVTSDY